VAYFNDDNNQRPSKKLLTFDQILWEKLSREDRQLSNEQRIERIKFKDDKGELNWTDIFFDSYRKKLAIFNERNSKTKYKYHFEDNQSTLSQEIFKIYEETTVSNIHSIFSLKKKTF
jgi:hypothetical protein